MHRVCGCMAVVDARALLQLQRAVVCFVSWVQWMRRMSRLWWMHGNCQSACSGCTSCSTNCNASCNVNCSGACKNSLLERLLELITHWRLICSFL